MHDRFAANYKAIRIFRRIHGVSPKSMACWSHTCDHVGGNFETKVLKRFTKGFNAMVSRSINVKELFREETGESIRKPSATRWWSDFEQTVQIMNWSPRLETVERVLKKAIEKKYCKETASSLLKMLSDPDPL